jgi:thiamine biosynthesis lipoprotein
MKNIIRIFLYVLLFLPALSCVPKDRYVTITGYAQGGTYTVKLNLNGHDGPVSAEPEEIRDSIDSILSRIDKSLSGYNRNSLLSRFNAGEEIVPNALFIDSYHIGRQIFEQTEGVVDVAGAPLYDIWGFGFKTGEMPTDAHVAYVRDN